MKIEDCAQIAQFLERDAFVASTVIKLSHIQHQKQFTSRAQWATPRRGRQGPSPRVRYTLTLTPAM